MSVENWLYPTPKGLYCEPGGFYIDPPAAVDRAIITHGHSDHARGGHGAVLATAETIAIMKVRMGAGCAGAFQALDLGETLTLGGVDVRLAPAGHILGSAQVVMDYEGKRAVVTGDYKRASDPTAAAFELVPCDLLVTEATFGLPVFRHEPAEREIGKLLASVATFPERTHLVGAYGLGKCQRLIALLRNAGYDAPVWLHGAMQGLVRSLRQPRRALGRSQAGGRSDQGGTRRRHRLVSAERAGRSLVQTHERSRHGVRVGLDAGAGRVPGNAASSCR